MSTPISNEKIRDETLKILEKRAKKPLGKIALKGKFFRSLLPSQFLRVVESLREEFGVNGFSIAEDEFTSLLDRGVDFIIDKINPVSAPSAGMRTGQSASLSALGESNHSSERELAFDAGDEPEETLPVPTQPKSKAAPKPTIEQPGRKRTNTIANYLKKHKLMDVLGEYGDKNGSLNVSLHSSGHALIVEWKSIFESVNGVLFQDELSTGNDPSNPNTLDAAHRKIAEGEFVVECGKSERYQLVAEFIYKGANKKPSDCSLKICPLDDDDCPEHTGAIMGHDGAILFYTKLEGKLRYNEEQIWPFDSKLGVKASWTARGRKSKT